MLPQLESSAAQLTHERPGFGMHHFVVLQLVLVDELLVAMLARMTSLAQMTLDMDTQMMTVRESPVAQRARVSLDAEMVFNMFRQRRILSESLAAQVTNQRLLPGVDSSMLFHVPFVRETSEAYVARVLFDTLVHVPAMHP